MQTFKGKGAGVLAFEFAGHYATQGIKCKLFKHNGKWHVELN